MLPDKLHHGDSISRIFDLWNRLIDHLQENRLVSGRGVSITKTPCGQIINASPRSASVPAPAASSASDDPHPFDVELVNSGSDDNPSYSVKIFDSTAPDSGLAGIVYLGTSAYSIPAAVLAPVASGYFYVDLLIQYDPATGYSFSFVTRTDSPVNDNNRTARVAIAYGNSTNIASRISSDIRISDRWL